MFSLFPQPPSEVSSIAVAHSTVISATIFGNQSKMVKDKQLAKLVLDEAIDIEPKVGSPNTIFRF
jgi:hypothetical protein